MILYHASDVEVANPEIRRTVYTKDFGYGFYCTANYAQAERWARRDRNLVPMINHYEYEPLPNLKTKKFPVMTDEWPESSSSRRQSSGGNARRSAGALAASRGRR